jgi:uncharacterized protein
MDLGRIPLVKDSKPFHLPFKEHLDPEVLHWNRGSVEFKNPLEIEGEVSKISGEWSLVGAVKGIKKMSCNRCLSPFEKSFHQQMQLDFGSPKGAYLNTLPEIGEEIYDSAIQLLCREDCKGLCAKCGVNLNDEACRCPSK